MKIAYSSDFHIDFFCNELNTNSLKFERQAHNFINNVLKPDEAKADTLLIAGDIGHYNSQNVRVLQMLKSYYKNIAVTYGNHDLYLMTGEQQSKYKYKSSNRVDELKLMLSDIGIYCLDGKVVNFDGVSIGGLPMWYDLPTSNDTKQWHRFMNDSRYIIDGMEYGQGVYSRSKLQGVPFDTQKFYLEQVEKLKRMVKTDILLTHVCPTILPDSMRAHDFVSGDYNIFYESDNSANVKADICVFGHSHHNGSFTDGNTTYYTSCIGYKHENLGSKISTLTL